jgi:cyclase
MNRKKIICPLLLILLLPALAIAQGRVVESDSHRFEEVAEGVWLATGTGSVLTMSNAMVLVGEFDTLVVDSHVTPAAARALIDSISVITDKPIRYLVNSHYHFDHAHGNQAFPAGIEIIGHEFTRKKLNGELDVMPQESVFHQYSDSLPVTVSRLEREAATETDPARKAELQERYRVQHDNLNASREIRPTPPNITLETKMSLFQVVANGSREIQLHHFGRAHTGGDVVIYLPQDKVVFTGDMVLPNLPYMGEGHVDEWPATLDGLLTLDFDTWLPGHGAVMRTKAPIANLQAYLRDLWSKTSAMHSRGVSVDQAAQQIDMTEHSQNFEQIQAVGVAPVVIRRIYTLLDQ